MSLDSPSTLVVEGATLKVGVVAARYNQRLVDGLLSRVRAVLADAGVGDENVSVVRVPGSGELPFAMQQLLAAREVDVGIALGVVIKGGTMHDQLVAEGAQNGLVRVGLDARTPVIVGIVAANNIEQAEARCVGDINRGAEFARAALEMAALKNQLSS